VTTIISPDPPLWYVQEIVLVAGIGHEQVEEPVVVVVRPGRTDTRSDGIHPRPAGDCAEDFGTARTKVVEEKTAFVGIKTGSEQVKVAVVVVVTKHARAEVTERRHHRLCRDFSELEVAVVVVEATVPSERGGDEDVGESVVVIVHQGAAPGT